jgi:putative ABC transport system permease protein
MLHLALASLWQEKARFALSVMGVALAILLILLLGSFQVGLSRQVTAYLDHMPVDYLVAQEGVRNLLGARSLLAADTDDRVRSVPGVARAVAIISQFVILDLHDKKVVGYLVGYDPDRGGGPWRLQQGRLPTDDDEVTLDWVMAQTHGLRVGDSLEILDQPFTVVGLTAGTNSWMAGFLFMHRRGAERILRSGDRYSFVLVTLAPDADRTAVEARLRRRLRALEVLPVATVKQNDRNLLIRIFALPLRLMAGIAFAVGSAILGMVIYTATVERRHEYGVLKAVGAANRQIYLLVTQQGLIIALLGALAGSGLAWGAMAGIMAVKPKFLLVLAPDLIVQALLGALAMGLLAALAPVRALADLDPAQVFRK